MIYHLPSIRLPLRQMTRCGRHSIPKTFRVTGPKHQLLYRRTINSCGIMFTAYRFGFYATQAPVVMYLPYWICTWLGGTLP